MRGTEKKGGHTHTDGIRIIYKVALKVFSHCPPDRVKLLIIL
jgi:hypothetical protein